MLNEQLKKNVEKQSKYVLKLTNDLKDTVINSHLIDLEKSIKSMVKKKNLTVYVIES
jgi:phosphatidate phosphatase APP1